MKKIFDSVSLNGRLVLKNRVARSATYDAIAYGGRTNDQIRKIYRDLAEGNVGMIVTGQTEVSTNGGTWDTAVKAYLPEYEEELRVICEDVHRFGSALIVQLNHGGIKSRSQENPLVGPSPLEPAPGVVVRELSIEEIKAIVNDFASAAQKVYRAGGDGVQIHNAHGYLLATFFSPRTNQRTDEYGGSTENRARIILEVYDAIRKAVPDEKFVIGIKTNLSDLISPSITTDEVVWLCKELEKRGLDFAEFSCGIMPGGPGPQHYLPMPEKPHETIFYRATVNMASQLNIPVFAVNGYRSVEQIETCLNESNIEGISMCRPFICEPGLLNRWMAGDLRPSICKSCAACEQDTNWIQGCKARPEEVKKLLWFGCPVKEGKSRTQPLEG